MQQIYVPVCVANAKEMVVWCMVSEGLPRLRLCHDAPIRCCAVKMFCGGEQKTGVRVADHEVSDTGLWTRLR